MSTVQAVSHSELVAAALIAAAKSAEQRFIRSDLPAGSKHRVKVLINADVDGYPFSDLWETQLEVGHDSVRAHSVGVTPGELLAYLLSKVNETTRQATLRDLSEVFAKHGKLPVDDLEVEAADAALQRLRQKKDQKVKGTVRVTPITG